jgi:5-amino-6-(5-phosphoribosylamino)uracil reductase
VVLSCAVSVDGYLDDASDTRLVLSNEADLDRVHEVRAGVDAILVGANTIRRDNPRLLVRGAAAGPVKVTVTAGGDLDPASLFFTTGDADKLVYAPTETAVKLRDRLAGLATVVDCGEPVELAAVLADLGARGIRRLMVEGGGTILTHLLADGLADELHLAVAPVLIGDSSAPRFVHNGRFNTPMALAEVRRIGEIVVLRYVFGSAAEDRRLLAEAVELSRRCPPSSTAFSVGAVIVDRDGVELARGYSRESDDTVHAEEAALAKLPPGDPRLRSATIYSSMEPCGKRASRPRTCSQLILEAGLPRVVFAVREPTTFVHPTGAEQLAAAGIDLVEIADLADEVRQINRHLG